MPEKKRPITVVPRPSVGDKVQGGVEPGKLPVTRPKPSTGEKKDK